jgi:hypothetical protein
LSPSLSNPSLFTDSVDHANLRLPQAAFWNLHLMRHATIEHRRMWNEAYETAKAETDRASRGLDIATETEAFLTWELERVVQSVEAQASKVRVELLSLDAETRCMVAHCSNMQDLSRRTIPRRLTGHHTTIISSPLLLLLAILHWTCHNTALTIPTLSPPHTHAYITMPDAETPTGPCTTITSSL